MDEGQGSASRFWPGGPDRYGSILTKQRGYGDLEALEQARVGALPRVPAASQLVGAGFQVQDFNRLRLRINEPVLPHAGLLVEVALVNAVLLPGPRRDDLGDLYLLPNRLVAPQHFQ